MSHRALGCLFELAEAFALGLAVILAMELFVAEPYHVQKPDMEDTLSSGQYVLVDKLSPRFDAYHRGDVVVFNPPATWEASHEALVLRVIAVAGDTIDIHDGGVFVNGTQLYERYLHTGDVTAPADPKKHVWTLGSDQLFVMGDHRTNSKDSRNYGPIGKSTVIGRAFLRFWPLSGLSLLPLAKLPPIPGPQPSPQPSPTP